MNDSNIVPNVFQTYSWTCPSNGCGITIPDISVTDDINLIIRIHQRAHRPGQMARVAISINGLKTQVNVFAPHRKRASDGTWPNAAHQAKGNRSDHNPWYNDIITAVDVTHDPSGGFDCEDFASSLIQSGDPRIKYIIWNRRIYENRQGYRDSKRWVSYHGENPHVSHLHLSVVAAPICDSAIMWNLSIFKLIQFGNWNERVRAVQSKLDSIGFSLVADGQFGKKTKIAVEGFQKRAGIYVDGVVGPVTLSRLGINV